MSSFYGGGAGSGAGSGGTAGVGIANLEIDSNRHLIVYLTDGTRKDLGVVSGATFTPEVIDGVLTWANDQGLENPDSFDFKGLVPEVEEEGEMWYPVGEATDEDIIAGTAVQTWEHI